MMFWYGPHGPGIGWSIVMTLLMLAFRGGIVGLIVYALRGPGPQDRGTGVPDPKRILDERLARGEIDADEYRARLEVLTGRR